MKGNLIQVRKLIKHETLEIQTNSEIISKFDDLETDFEQYYDQIRIMREILNSSLDAYGGIVSNNLNEVMKTLTIFTILLSNPILIASVYGMNINLPFADHPFSLYFLLIFSILLSGIMILYMKRRNIL
jgi:magnesium transporter